MAVELHELKPHDHPCLIYETKEEQIAAFVPYLQAGLAQGEKCVYIVDDSDPAWVLQALSSNNFPIDDYVQHGAFTVMTTRDAYLKDGYFDTEKMVNFWGERIKEANAGGYPALRAAAEMTWALSKEKGCEQLVCYESHLNNVFPHANVSALCQYNKKRFTAQIVKDMIHVHPLICVAGELIENPAYIRPEEFIESHAEMDVQALVDNLLMTKRLAQANAKLQEALAAKERASAMIEERQRECESLYQELLSLARVVSHELQAPLNVMQSYLRLLSARYKGNLGKDADEFIDKSVGASRLVVRMIDDLWNYARVDSPAESVVENIDVMEVITDVIEQLRPKITECGAVIGHDADLPNVPASRRHIEFVLKALLTNSLQYSSSTTRPEIYVGSRETAEQWLFAVRDNGRGIDPIHSHDVFRLFYRLHGSPCEDGTGMGLAICKRIIQHYDGKIWFESESGNTTFYFSIPKQTIASNVTDLRLFAREKLQKSEA